MVSGPLDILFTQVPSVEIAIAFKFCIALGKSHSSGSPSVEIMNVFSLLEITFPLHRRAPWIILAPLMVTLHLKFDVVVVIKTDSFK